MSRRAWGAFAAVSVLWGLPYLFIKIADDGGMPPLVLAWLRVALGAAVLLAIAWRAGTLPALRGHGRWLCAFAVAEIAIPFPMIAAGEKKVASSTAAILIATTPLLIALLSLRFDATERVTGRRLLGLLIGLAGVGALVGVDISGDGGRLPDDRRRGPHPVRRPRPADPGADRRRVRLGRRPRPLLHGAGAGLDGDPDRRRRPFARLGHHLHQPGDRARPRGRLPQREPRPRLARRPRPDPGRLLVLDPRDAGTRS